MASQKGQVLHSKLAMKGLGIGNKLRQRNIVDLFPDSLIDPDR